MCLKASGYPTNRCCLTGSARYAELAVLVQDNAPSESCTEDTRDAEVTRVLVIPSLSTHDAQGLIGVTAQACGEDGQYTILVKPHPHSPVDQYVENARDRYKLKDVRMVSGNIHTLIREADVIITSYSTAGDEAIALGRPVICYSGLSPCMASFLDIEAAPIVHSADELRRSLWNMLHDPAYRRKYQDRWASLVEGSFYSLDGKASERIVEALLPRAD